MQSDQIIISTTCTDYTRIVTGQWEIIINWFIFIILFYFYIFFFLLVNQPTGNVISKLQDLVHCFFFSNVWITLKRAQLKHDWSNTKHQTHWWIRLDQVGKFSIWTRILFFRFRIVYPHLQLYLAQWIAIEIWPNQWAIAK